MDAADIPRPGRRLLPEYVLLMKLCRTLIPGVHDGRQDCRIVRLNGLDPVKASKRIHAALKPLKAANPHLVYSVLNPKDDTLLVISTEAEEE